MKFDRQAEIGRAVKYFAQESWPTERLSKSDIWNACGYALSGEHEDFRTNDLDPTKIGFDRKFRRLLRKHLNERQRTILMVEDFNELSIRAHAIEDVSDLLYSLFDPAERIDDNLILVADDGFAGSKPGISEYVTRGEFIECAHLGPDCLEDLIEKVLSGTSARELIRNTQDAAEKMREAFGCCIFLHHILLHRIREIPAKSQARYKTVSLLTEAIDEILEILRKREEAKKPVEATDIHLRRFADSVLLRLNMLENPLRTRSSLALGELDNSIGQHAARFLEWSGYVERSGSVPGFVQSICELLVQQVLLLHSIGIAAISSFAKSSSILQRCSVVL